MIKKSPIKNIRFKKIIIEQFPVIQCVGLEPNPDQFNYAQIEMVECKYIILGAFDHQIGQLIFGKSLDIFLFIRKIPKQMIKWEQTYLLDHRLIYCYYVHN